MNFVMKRILTLLIIVSSTLFLQIGIVSAETKQSFAHQRNHKASLMNKAILSRDIKAVTALRRMAIPLGQNRNSSLGGLARFKDASGLAMVEFLLKSGLNPNYTDIASYTPLANAIRNENEKMVALLLQYQANLHLDVRGTQCQTVMPLDYAITRGNKRIIQMLRKAGAPRKAQCNC